MEGNRVLPFGKKVSVGNFYFVKITRALSKKELRELRDAQGIPEEIRKSLGRGGLPFIVINTVGGGWSLCFVAGSVMFNYIEYAYSTGELEPLRRLFTMMYADTSVLGDAEYIRAKGDALTAFMDRQKVNDNVNDNEGREDEDLESVKVAMEGEEALREQIGEAIDGLSEEK